jgi:hypothetical protein
MAAVVDRDTTLRTSHRGLELSSAAIDAIASRVAVLLASSATARLIDAAEVARRYGTCAPGSTTTPPSWVPCVWEPAPGLGSASTRLGSRKY